MFIADQDEIVDPEKLRKLISSKNHCVYRQQKHEIQIEEIDFENFLTNIPKFPLIFSVLAGAIDVTYLTFEEDIRSSNDEPPPLTPPEFDQPKVESKVDPVLIASMENTFKAVSGTPISPTMVWLTKECFISFSRSLRTFASKLSACYENGVKTIKISLPHETTACATAIHSANNHMVAVGRSDNIVTCFSGSDKNSAKSIDMIGHSRSVWSAAWGHSMDNFFLYTDLVTKFNCTGTCVPSTRF